MFNTFRNLALLSKRGSVLRRKLAAKCPTMAQMTALDDLLSAEDDDETLEKE